MIADELKDESKALAKRERQEEQRKRDLARAKTPRQYAWDAIQNGADPEYVAVRYGFAVEEMQRAATEHKRREELIYARANAAVPDR